MTAPTVAVEWLLARAAVRTTGLLHIVSRRDSGALNPMCAANQIRSEQIEEHRSLASVTDLSLLCDDCASRAASIGGTVVDGVSLLLGLTETATTVRLLEVPVAAVHAARTHPRRSPGDVDGLVASVHERGVVTPIVARRSGTGFEVIDGARRLYAAHVAGLSTIPAVVRDASDADALLDALVANLHRAELNPIEQAHAYERALEVLGCSKEALGQRLGVSRSQISNTVRLLGLSAEDQDRIAAGDLTAQAGRALLAGPRATPAPLPEISALLAGLLAAKVQVTHAAGRARIVIDVPDADRDRVLEQLGVPAVA